MKASKKKKPSWKYGFFLGFLSFCWSVFILLSPELAKDSNWIPTIYRSIIDTHGIVTAVSITGIPGIIVMFFSYKERHNQDS